MAKKKFPESLKIALIILLVIAILIPIAVIAVVSLPWTILYLGILLSPDPPTPEVTYGEFPFSLVYEIDGERVEIKDTLVIEHLGKGMNEGNGKYNKWNSYYKNSQEYTYTREIILFRGNIEELIGPVRVVFALGTCEYYMGLPDTSSSKKPGDIIIYYYEEDNDSFNGLRNVIRPITEEELYDYCGIRIIEKSISDPIT